MNKNRKIIFNFMTLYTFLIALIRRQKSIVFSDIVRDHRERLESKCCTLEHGITIAVNTVLFGPKNISQEPWGGGVKLVESLCLRSQNGSVCEIRSRVRPAVFATYFAPPWRYFKAGLQTAQRRDTKRFTAKKHFCDGTGTR